MNNGKTIVKEITYRVAFLLMGAQIILGALWLCGNLLQGQNFPQTAEFLEISETWVLDDYVGIAYPAVLWLLRKVFGKHYTVPLYLLQAAAVFGASAFLVARSGVVSGIRSKKQRKWRILAGGAYLSSIPIVLQFQTAQLPCAFGAALFLFVLGECFFLCSGEKNPVKSVWRHVAAILAGWFAGALFLPEYIWIMMVPLTVTFGIYLWKQKKGYGIILAGFAAVLFLNIFAAECYQQPGSRGRMEQSVSATLLRRVVWPNFYKDSFFWSHLVKILYTEDMLQETALEPENVVYFFGPLMEQTYGRETAVSEYMLMVKDTWSVRTKEVTGEIVRDMSAYLFPQLSVLLQLQGVGASRTGFGYHYLSEQTPLLTKYYVNVSLAGFVFLLPLGAILFFKRKKDGDNSGQGKKAGCVIFISAAAAAALTFWYTMEAAGMWDYGNVMVNSALWALAGIGLWNRVWPEKNEILPKERTTKGGEEWAEGF